MGRPKNIDKAKKALEELGELPDFIEKKKQDHIKWLEKYFKGKSRPSRKAVIERNLRMADDLRHIRLYKAWLQGDEKALFELEREIMGRYEHKPKEEQSDDENSEIKIIELPEMKPVDIQDVKSQNSNMETSSGTTDGVS